MDEKLVKWASGATWQRSCSGPGPEEARAERAGEAPREPSWHVGQVWLGPGGGQGNKGRSGGI